MRKYLVVFYCLVCMNSCAKDYVKEAQKAYSNKDYRQVIEIANKGLSKKENKELLSLRGLSYFELREFEQASKDLNQVVVSGSGSLEIMEKSVEVNLYIDRNELAALGYKELIKRDSTNKEYYYHRAEAYTNLEVYSKAFKDLDKALDIDSSYLQAINQKGIVYQRLNDFDNAIIWFTKAIRLSSKNAELYYNRAISLYILDHNTNALSDINKAIELKENNSLLIYSRAAIFKSLGNKDSCCQDLKQAISLGHKAIDKELLDYCNINPLTK